MAYHWAIEWREREREREADEEETGGIAQNGCDVECGCLYIVQVLCIEFEWVLVRLE